MRGGTAGPTSAGPEVDRDLPLDAHLHTDLGPDSDVPTDVYCAAAVECGIPEIAITDCVDSDPRAPAYAGGASRRLARAAMLERLRVGRRPALP